MKRGRLPLTALRSFEAAGRLTSFSRAAEELYVSQAAISRQIRDLERLLGRPLFERLHRRVALTEAGRSLLEQLTESFDAIDRRLAQIMAAPVQVELKVSVEPSFAAALLIPRLASFHLLHPDIDVIVDANLELIEFRRHDAEIAIRYGAQSNSWPRVESRHLFDVSLTPVMAPSLMRSRPPVETPGDLRGFPLLHDTNRDFWGDWFRLAGVTDYVPERGAIFPDSAMVVQSARLGHGVGLGDRKMEAIDLAAGTLVRPFDVELPQGAYWLVTPDFAKLSPTAEAFAQWASAEFGGRRDASSPLEETD